MRHTKNGPGVEIEQKRHIIKTIKLSFFSLKLANSNKK